MQKFYTTDQLIQFVYHETGVLQSFEIEQAIASDAEWKSTHENITTAKNSLPKVSFAPRQSSIEAILRYSAEQAHGVSLT